MNSKNIAFSEENLMLLGVLDEVYDLYQVCCDIINDAYEREKSARSDAIIWPDKLNRLCKKPIGIFLDQYINIFTFRYFRIYINDKAMAEFDMFDVSCPEPLNLIYSPISFRKFINKLEIIITRACWLKRKKDKPQISYEAVKREIDDYILWKISQNKMPLISVGKLDKTHSEIIQTIWVYSNVSTTKCIKEKHSTEFRMACVPALEFQDYIKLTVRYCQECDRYFISKQTLSAFEKKYGLMLVSKFQYTIKSELLNDIYSSFRSESRLHSIGYNVQAGQMDEKMRRRLLLTIIDTGCMTAEEVIQDIENAVAIFSRNPRFNVALKKWEDDLVFVNEYIKKGQPIYARLAECKCK